MSEQNEQTNQNTQTNWKVSILVPIIVAIIGAIATIVSNYVGKEKAVDEVINQTTNTVNVNSIDELITTYNQLIIDNLNLKDGILTIEKENNSLISENESLKSENEFLKSEKVQYSSSTDDITALLEENNSLKIEIAELRSEINTLNNNISNYNYNEKSTDSTLVTVPNVVGRTQEDAVLILHNSNLNFQVFCYEDDIGDKYNVAEQSIPAYSKVEVGTIIELRLVAY